MLHLRLSLRSGSALRAIVCASVPSRATRVPLKAACQPQCLLKHGPSTLQRRYFISNLKERLTHEKGTGGMTSIRASAVAVFAMSAIAIGITTYTVHKYYQFVNMTMHKFPEPVAKELRKAIYYRRQKEAKDAVEHYRRALELAAECEMNPLSDEITGLKIELAGYLGENGRRDREVEIYWSVWNELIRACEVYEDGDERMRLAKRAVSVGVKLGELFNESGMRKREEEVLTKSVEIMLREFGPRLDSETSNTSNCAPKNVMSHEEVGAALESLGNFYESTDRPALATPLFLRALSLCEPNSCHAVSLMSSLASTLATHPTAPGKSRGDFLSNASQWALKALEIDNSIKPPVRTDECDAACVAAIYNLGAIASIRGDRVEARKRFLEAKSLAEGIGQSDYTVRIQDALNKL